MKELFPGARRLEAVAWLVGERIDARGLTGFETVGTGPTTYRVGEGVVVLFRYGAAVAFGLTEPGGAGFLAALAPHVSGAFASPAHDDATLRIDPEHRDAVDPDGTLVLRDTSLERIQVVAHALARSALLAHYEAQLAQALERVEPPVEELRRRGRTRLQNRALLRQLGEILVNEMRMVGRAEVSEKPELTWARPDLDRLYVLLAEEYELEPRDRAVARKLDLMSRTADSFLGILQHRRSLHVEWYIVILIAVEIVILVYDMFWRK